MYSVRQEVCSFSFALDQMEVQFQVQFGKELVDILILIKMSLSGIITCSVHTNVKMFCFFYFSNYLSEYLKGINESVLCPVLVTVFYLDVV